MNIEELLAMESKNLFVTNTNGKTEYETTVENGTIIRFAVVCLKTVEGEITSLNKEKSVLESRLKEIDSRINELEKLKSELVIPEEIPPEVVIIENQESGEILVKDKN